MLLIGGHVWDHNAAMPDSLTFRTLPAAWLTASHQIAAMFQHLPLTRRGQVMAYGLSPEAALAVQAAAQLVAMECALLPLETPAAEVQSHCEHRQPNIVVCAPQVFGWVSKLTFLHGGHAIYTCGVDGEGTLLDRAAHFLASEDKHG
jgi:hypothetical protein